VEFDTKIAVVLRDDLAVWQKANVTAFLVSGVAGTNPDTVGEPYRDASGNEYLPMFVSPVLVYEADAAALRRAYERAMDRGVVAGDLHERALRDRPLTRRTAPRSPRSAPRTRPRRDRVRAERKTVDKVVDRLRFHV
jgi:hypothetical protein